MSGQQPEEKPLPVVKHHAEFQSDSPEHISPVTIFQVLQAEASPDNKSLVIEGRSAQFVMLVAHVSSVEVHAAKCTYTLDDGTGRIVAERILTAIKHYYGSSREVEEEEIAQSKALEHTYVEVVGCLLVGDLKWKPKIKVNCIHPANNYNQVMFHILNVIYSSRCIQQCAQSHSSNVHLVSDDDMDQDHVSIQHDNPQIPQIIPPSDGMLSNAFSPQKRQPYCTLGVLERAIMVIQTSHGCTESQFNLAIQALLSEAYITSPLDDGYVVLTPRH